MRHWFVFGCCVGKIAVVWMIGEYGDEIDEAPYILEPLIDAFNEETSRIVRIEILTTAMKLFFKRPPEMQKMLGNEMQCIRVELTQSWKMPNQVIIPCLCVKDVY